MANLTGFPGSFPHPTSEVATTPFPIQPGTRARDGNGNEYVYCDLTGTVYGGVTVAISNDGNFTAAALTATHRGAVGVAAVPGTSDNAIWVQIYGYNAAAQIGGAFDASAATSASYPVAQSSASSPAAGLEAATATSDEYHKIYGMYIVGAASTATTSATSATGATVPVFLNYPRVDGHLTFIADPTS